MSGSAANSAGGGGGGSGGARGAVGGGGGGLGQCLFRQHDLQPTEAYSIGEPRFRV